MDTVTRKAPPGWFERERVRAFGFIALTALAAWLCYLVALPFLPAMGWAIALAVIAYPIDKWIRLRVRGEAVGALLTVALVTVIIVVPAVLVARQLMHEAAASVEDVKSGIAGDRWRSAIERNPRLAPALTWIEREVNVREQVEEATQGAINGARKVIVGSFYAVIELLVTLFLLFYFLRDRRPILQALRRLVPTSDGEAHSMFDDVRDAIIAIVFGILIVAAVQGVLGGLMFWWLGLPAPLLWGTVMAVLSVLPVLGAAIVWVPAAAFLALEGSWEKALILAAWGGIVVALVDNLLYPLLIKNRLRLHTVPVFIAVLGGLVAFGPVGIVLGPVVLVVAVALLDSWRRRMTAESRARG